MAKKLEHDGLIFKVAKRYAWALSEGLDFEDLMQAGRLGCARAAENSIQSEDAPSLRTPRTGSPRTSGAK